MSSALRAIVCRGLTDGDAVEVTFLPAAELATVRGFYDESANPLWRQGREAGWLSSQLRCDFFEPTLFRGDAPGPPPRLEPGAGLAFCGHGLTVGFKT
eukprot:7160948-Prymnesium_polylepis.1